MSLVRMSLVRRIRAYAASKSGPRQSAHNRVKERVFTDIANLAEQKRLTVASLTELLAKLTEVERYRLFYRAREFGSLAKKASIYSQAAQWIQLLYLRLGVSLTKLDLAIIVAEGINPQNAKQLKQFPYRQCLKKPLDKEARAFLERELKEELGLPMQEEAPLAALLYQLPMQRLEQCLQELRSRLKPSALLAEFIDQLYVLHQQNQEEERFISELWTYASRDLQFIPDFMEANSLIATAFVVRQPHLFFRLSEAFQKAVVLRLEQKDERETLIRLNELANPEFVASPLQGFEQTELRKILTEFQYRKEASIGPTHAGYDTYVELRARIVQALCAAPEQAYARQQIEPALAAIDHYLAHLPNIEKRRFFRKLALDVGERGLSVELLQAHLNEANLAKLFAKWTGPEKSRAAALMARLYALASFGEGLSKKQKLRMVRQGELPPANNLRQKAETALMALVDKAFAEPLATKCSELGRAVLKELAYYQSFFLLAQKEVETKQKQTALFYQNYLLEKGFAQLEEQARTGGLIFDPQGHALVRLSLQAPDYLAILQRSTGMLLPADLGEEELKALLEEQLGMKLTQSTLCNFDIVQHQQLREQFIAQLSQKAQVLTPTKRLLFSKALDSYLHCSERGAIIALQEEMTMHLSLCLRALEKAAAKPLLTNAARNLLVQKLNQEVLQYFCEALSDSYRSEEGLDYSLLNNKLDAARAKLAPFCRQKLVAAIISSTKDSPAELYTEVIAKLDKQGFIGTTATGVDYLRTDSLNETLVHLTATDKTAHSKKKGKENQALRLLSRNHYCPTTNRVSASIDFRIEARVPSIAEYSGLHEIAAKDVAEKLAYSHNLLRQRAPAYRGPLIYNLLTSLHTKFYDISFFESGNRQRASAARILKGSHYYNLQQVQKGEIEALIYVQNIPVNQHTQRLNLQADDKATAEAALMSELALLSTFKYHAALFPPLLRTSIVKNQESIHDYYLHFLPQASDVDHYFKDSIEGKAAIRSLEEQKRIWREFKGLSPAATIQDLAVQALFKIYVHNEHQDKQFGMLVQALSVFIEPLSQAGCKSANERYQAVCGRVELLHILANKEGGLSPEQKMVYKALKAFIADNSSLELVQEAIDKAYNKHNLQGAAAAISDEDQGAPSKIRASDNQDKRGVIKEMDTNIAETNYLTNLHQRFSSEMQAHKSPLAGEFNRLFKEEMQALAEQSERAQEMTALTRPVSLGSGFGE